MSYVTRLAQSEDLQAIQKLGVGIDLEDLADTSGNGLHLAVFDSDTLALIAYGGFRAGGSQPGTHTLRICGHPDSREEGLETLLLQRLLKGFKVQGGVLGARVPDDESTLLRLLGQNGFVEVERMLNMALTLDEIDLNIFDSLLKRIPERNIEIVCLADEMKTDPDALLTWHTFEQSTGSDGSFEDFCSWYKRREVIPEACFFAKKGTAYIGNSFLSLLNVKTEPNVMEQGYTQVDKDYRNQGIATVLKVFTTSFAKEKGYHLLKTSTKQSNAPMKAVNKKFGFKVTSSELFLKQEIKYQQSDNI